MLHPGLAQVRLLMAATLSRGPRRADADPWLWFGAADPYPVAMSPEGLPPPPPPPPRDQRGPGRGLPGQGMPKWGLYALLGLTLSVVLLGPLLSGAGDPEKVAYSDFMADVREGNVKSVEIDNTDGSITGELDERRRVPHHRPARRRHPRRRPRGPPRPRASRSSTRRPPPASS